MDILLKLQALLDGKKTYLTGLAAICTGLVNHDYQMVYLGLTGIFLRNSISKS